MNSTDLSQLTIKELKSIVLENDIEVLGDKRLKATYFNAIETFQSEQTVTDIESLPAMPDPFEVAIEMETVSQSSIDLPLVEAVTDSTHWTMGESIAQVTGCANETPAPQRQASIVALIPLILLTVAVISIRIGISALIPIIGSLMRFIGSIGQSFTHTDRGTESIPIAHPLRVVDYSTVAA